VAGSWIPDAAHIHLKRASLSRRAPKRKFIARRDMREWLTQPAGAAALAFITTLHCGLLLLRNYRSGKTARLAILPSIVFMAAPWVLASPPWLAFGLAAHIAWFVACERLLPSPAVSAPRPVAAKPVTPPRGFQPLAVLAVLPETSEIRSFRLTRPEGFKFTAGQFVMVRVSIDGKALVRCYSITSSPSTMGYLEIAVRRQGIVSRFLHDTLQSGTSLETNGPGGAFVYPAGNRPIVLLAGGIGITPLLAMLRHGLSTEPFRRITLVLSAKTVEQVPFLDELVVLERRHPQFRLAIALSGGTCDSRFLSGRIDRQTVESIVARPEECVYMLCGPLPMIDEMRRVLETLGVPSSRVHFEKFESAVSLAAAAAGPVRLTLQKTRRTIEVGAVQTILEAAETAGVPLASMCRVGVCATCRIRLTSGEVEGDFDALDPSDQEAGFVLACVARPRTDCVVEA
jgi:ferredoxin-NADP reductase